MKDWKPKLWNCHINQVTNTRSWGRKNLQSRDNMFWCYGLLGFLFAYLIRL